MHDDAMTLITTFEVCYQHGEKADNDDCLIMALGEIK